MPSLLPQALLIRGPTVRHGKSASGAEKIVLALYDLVHLDLHNRRRGDTARESDVNNPATSHWVPCGSSCVRVVQCIVDVQARHVELDWSGHRFRHPALFLFALVGAENAAKHGACADQVDGGGNEAEGPACFERNKEPYRSCQTQPRRRSAGKRKKKKSARCTMHTREAGK